jgi:hypothetical protein
MPKKSGPEYPAVLRRPIDPKKLVAKALSSGKALPGSTDQLLARELTLRLLALANFYSVDVMAPNGHLLLLLEVLRHHVPGFRTAGRAGRQRKWTDRQLVELGADIDRLRKEGKKRTILELCTLLKKDPRFRDRYKRLAPSSLHRYYSEFKKLKSKLREPYRWGEMIIEQLSQLGVSTGD